MKVAALNFEQAQHDIVRDIEAVNAWSRKFQDWANRQAKTFTLTSVLCESLCCGTLTYMHTEELNIQQFKFPMSRLVRDSSTANTSQRDMRRAFVKYAVS